MSFYDLCTRLPSKMLLCRHTESTLNELPREKGFFLTERSAQVMLDTPNHGIPLSKKGREQAKLVGWLIGSRFGIPDVIITSGYLRTEETFAGIASAFQRGELNDTQIESDVKFRERDNDLTSYMTLEEAEKHFPWLQRYWERTGPLFAKPPQGESIADMIPRVSLGLLQACALAQGGKLIIITHARTIACCRYLLEDWDISTMESFLRGSEPRNGGCTFYENDRYSLQKGMHLIEYDVVPKSKLFE